MVFAHAFAGLILAYFFQKQYFKKEIIKKENLKKLMLWIIAIFTSILPDLDVIYVIFTKVSSHRALITHALPLYITIAAILFIIFKLLEFPKIFTLLLKVFVFGTSIHIILDSLTDKVYFLKPIYNKFWNFSLFPLPELATFFDYLKSPNMLIESAIIATGLYFLIINFRNCKNNLLILLLMLFIINVGIGFTMFAFFI